MGAISRFELHHVSAPHRAIEHELGQISTSAMVQVSGSLELKISAISAVPRYSR
jgi:hypothetical protein